MIEELMKIITKETTNGNLEEILIKEGSKSDLLGTGWAKELKEILDKEKMLLNLKKQIDNKLNGESSFTGRLNKKWSEVFRISDGLYFLAVEVRKKYLSYVGTLSKEEKEGSYKTFKALDLILARAIQTYLEVLVLIKNGLVDGALARCSSLYRLAVIAAFIYEYGEDVAADYLKSDKFSERLSWAKKSGIKKKGEYYFRDILRHSYLKIKNLKEVVKLTGLKLYPSPPGTLNRFGIREGKVIKPTGRSDYGLIEPALWAAIDLLEILLIFLDLYPYEEGVFMGLSLQVWTETLIDLWTEKHKENFKAE